jgi:putative transposase
MCNLEPVVSASRVSPYQFVTLRAYEGAPLLAQGKIKQLLLDCFAETKKRFNLTVAGYVVLDDHVHFLFSLPADNECSAIMNDLRAGFMRARRKLTPLLERDPPNNTPFWAQAIEYRSTYSTDDLRAYLDFIHYDPVRHGITRHAADYPWSSLPARIAQGHYPETWADLGPPASIARVTRDFHPPEDKR